MLRIGHGYDVHAFADERRLVLGGIDIPYHRGLAGHSDADVVTHAVIDALLGAARLDDAGDIGELFPDTDPTFAGAHSLRLLSEVVSRINTVGYRIIDVDITVAAQVPKLSPYKLPMRTALAEVLGVALTSVGLKATTTEHLGFVGREEGIAAWAVVLLDASTQ